MISQFSYNCSFLFCFRCAVWNFNLLDYYFRGLLDLLLTSKSKIFLKLLFLTFTTSGLVLKSYLVLFNKLKILDSILSYYAPKMVY
jgi:hypothetical protein